MSNLLPRDVTQAELSLFVGSLAVQLPLDCQKMDEVVGSCDCLDGHSASEVHQVQFPLEIPQIRLSVGMCSTLLIDKVSLLAFAANFANIEFAELGNLLELNIGILFGRNEAESVGTPDVHFAVLLDQIGSFIAHTHEVSSSSQIYLLPSTYIFPSKGIQLVLV